MTVRAKVVPIRAVPSESSSFEASPGDVAHTDHRTVEVSMPRKPLGADAMAHAYKHVLNGSDELDGDKLGIDYEPADYTPAVVPDVADDTQHLASHLKGIDAKFALIAAELALMAPLLLPPVTEDDSITLAASHGNKLVRMNKATSQAVTVPANASVPLPIGFITSVAHWGAGELSYIAADGVNVRSLNGSLASAGQYAAPVTLVKVDTDEWLAAGGLA